VRVRFLLGPAGSGKTHECLSETAKSLNGDSFGPPLVFLAPKQSTYQLERQLLSMAGIAGYTRLSILSFERLALQIFDWLGKPKPKILNEEGRIMVLRCIAARKRKELKLFRASARLTGFAGQLSTALRELQRNDLSAEEIETIAQKLPETGGLRFKLQDLALLLRDYRMWLETHDLQDTDCLLTEAAKALNIAEPGLKKQIVLEHLWMDGFAELSTQELTLLQAIIPCCKEATLAFCLPAVSNQPLTWLSSWSVTQRAFEKCRARLSLLNDVTIEIRRTNPERASDRFASGDALRHLEANWDMPKPFEGSDLSQLESSLRLAICPNPESEAVLAAREILSHVAKGGRFRDVTVLTRSLADYHSTLAQAFSRFNIPFFIDRRELVSHHPLAELTRGALRTVVYGWTHEDWFTALKTGLLPATDGEIDRLENEALARGWQGNIWHQPLVIPGDPGATKYLADLYERIVPPFLRLALTLAKTKQICTGTQLASALRAFWASVEALKRLEAWTQQDVQEGGHLGGRVHLTVWEQINGWLDNLELAFSDESLTMREWIPILDAGLASLTVGLIPPALDQVLIGAADRSRNPEVKVAIVLGLNETVFPASPQSSALLSTADRDELARCNLELTGSVRQQLGRERHFGYLACTRARERLVLTCAQQNNSGSALNPSPFVSHVRQLFPSLVAEQIAGPTHWSNAIHPSELVIPLLKSRGERVQADLGRADKKAWQHVAGIPGLKAMLDRLQTFSALTPQDKVDPKRVEKLFGPVLKSSVSRLEYFATCPFRFFVQSGLKARERKLFELDVREKGIFQHDVLSVFHQQLSDEGKRWRELTPPQARERIRKISELLIETHREGLLKSSPETLFSGRMLGEALENFVGTLVHWMRSQYKFDPILVEFAFGGKDQPPAWEIDLGGGHKLALEGRIDRVDLCRDDQNKRTLCVIVDYKSRKQELDDTKMFNGLQLQLVSYLNVLRHWPEPKGLFKAQELIPAGMFYVNIKGNAKAPRNRSEALEADAVSAMLAYAHHGRFDWSALSLLDSRKAQKGDQFNYRLKNDGEKHGACKEPLSAEEFLALLDQGKQTLLEIGREIYAGVVRIDPYRKGQETPCLHCDYESICRIDRWTHIYRTLKSLKGIGE
jgi:ATP-dependent helicase/nuclease subunit B